MGRRLWHPFRAPLRRLCHPAAHTEAERIVLPGGRRAKPAGVVRSLRQGGAVCVSHLLPGDWIRTNLQQVEYGMKPSVVQVAVSPLPNSIYSHMLQRTSPVPTSDRCRTAKLSPTMKNGVA